MPKFPKNTSGFRMSMKSYGQGKSPLHKEMPPHIERQTKTNYKDSKSKSTNNEKTKLKKDDHNIHAEKTNYTGEWCVTCGEHRDDHNATHPFKKADKPKGPDTAPTKFSDPDLFGRKRKNKKGTVVSRTIKKIGRFITGKGKRKSLSNKGRTVMSSK